MDPTATFCPNWDYPARGQIGQGNIGIHSRKERIGNPNALFRPTPLAARLRRRSPFACGACRAPRSAPEPGGGTV